MAGFLETGGSRQGEGMQAKRGKSGLRVRGRDARWARRGKAEDSRGPAALQETGLQETGRQDTGDKSSTTGACRNAPSTRYALAVSKCLPATSQLTTFHQAPMYSGRRFWYFR